jgi:two-component system phosphate regulon response regulator OmpR
MSDEAHILVVDDDARLRGLLSRYLADQGFRVTTAADAADARDKLRFVHPDLMVLDVMMPGEGGLAFTASVRSDLGDTVPVLLLTARGAPEDRIAGFEAGADDYLGKPFSIDELVARVRALSRRGPRWTESVRRFGTLVVDRDRRVVAVNDRRLAMTAREFDIVALLAWREGRVVPRDEVLEAVWGDDSERAAASLEVLVARIRRKLGEHGLRDALRTVRQVGYAWALERSKPA